MADRLASSLAAVMSRKAFLREAAANALLALLEGLSEPVLARLLESNQQLRGLLLATPSDATPEVLLSSFQKSAPMPVNAQYWGNPLHRNP